MSVSASPVLTVGDVARHHNVEAWQVRRLFERGFLPAAARAGAYRVFTEDDLPAIEHALRSAGYLPAQAEVRNGH